MELQDKDKMVGSRVLQCLARLERRRRKTLTLGRDPWKGCQQHRSSRGLGRLRDTHVTPHEGTPPHGVNPENSRKGPRGDLELSGRRSGCSPFPTRPAPPRGDRGAHGLGLGPRARAHLCRSSLRRPRDRRIPCCDSAVTEGTSAATCACAAPAQKAIPGCRPSA